MWGSVSEMAGILESFSFSSVFSSATLKQQSATSVRGLHKSFVWKFGAIVLAVGMFLRGARSKELYRNGFEEASTSRMRCSAGYSLEGTFCVRTMRQKAETVCDIGSLEGGECVSYYEAQKVCPPDFDLATRRDRCLKVEKVLPSVVCEDGYQLDGLKCKAVKVVEAQCPNGMTAVGGDKCALYSRPAKRCPASYESGKHKEGRVECLKKITAEPIEYCPDSFSLKEGGGGCESVERVEAVCPKGSVEKKDGKCAVIERVEQKCSAGYALLVLESGGQRLSAVGRRGTAKCVKKLSEEPKAACESPEFVLSSDGKSCVNAVAIAPFVCGEGMKEAEDGRCAAYSAAEAKCPADFALEMREGVESCSKSTRRAAEVVCPNGYELADSNCVRKVKAAMVCPPGSEEVVGAEGREECVEQLAMSARCEDSSYELRTTWNGGRKCVKADRFTAMASCNEEFVLEPKQRYCEKVKTCEPVFLCEEGARAEGGRCVWHERTVPEWSCPLGFEKRQMRLGSAVCVQTVEKDCSSVQYKVECRDVPECYSRDCERKYGKRVLEERAEPGHFRSLTSRKKLCEKVAVKAKKMCKNELFADATAVCPEGSLAHGSECLVPHYHKPSAQCLEGMLNETRTLCEKTYRKKAVYSCPEGYKKTFDRKLKRLPMCSKVSSVEAIYYCEEGLPKPRSKLCEKVVAKVCEGEVCERKALIAASMRCPDGYHITHGATTSGGGSTCVKHDVLRPTFHCKDREAEYVEGLKRCVRYYAKECVGGNCERRSSTTVKRQCEEGFKLVRSSRATESYLYWSFFIGVQRPRTNNSVSGVKRERCEKTVYEKPEEICSNPDTTLLDGECVKYLPKTCPPSSSAKGGQCEMIRSMSVSYLCPKGYKQIKDFDFHTNFAPIAEQRRTMRKRYRGLTQIKCVAVRRAKFEYFCSKGEMAGKKGCAKYFEKTCPNNQCEENLTAAPKYSCAKGYFLSKASGRGDDQVPLCMAINIEKAVYKCPKGESDVTGKLCRKRYTPKYACRNGAKRSGLMCESRKIEKPFTTTVTGV